MYRKRVLTVLSLIVIVLVSMIAINKTLWNYGNLEIDRDWQFVENHYYSPMEGLPASAQAVDLYDIAGGEFGTSDRIRGTLYKNIEIPTSWQSTDLILFNNFFVDNVKIYINGDLYAVQGSFLTTGAESYLNAIDHFVYLKPSSKTLRIMILFDGYQDHIPALDEFYLMPSDKMIMRLSMTYGVNALGFFATLYLMWLVYKKPLVKKHRIQELTFVMLLFVRWAFVSNSLFLNQLPIKLDIWIKLSAIIQILMLSYTLVILFDRRKIWRRRLNIILALVTFVTSVLILLFNFINLKIIVLAYAAVAIVLYWMFRKQIRASGRYTELLIINVCLFADVIYRLHPFSPPVHLLILSVYGVYWHQMRYFEGYELVDEAQVQKDVSNPMPYILKEETASLYERFAEKASLAAVCISKNVPIYTPSAVEILKPEVGGVRIENYLFPHDLTQRQYFSEVITLTLTTSSTEEKRVYLELLPEQIEIENHIFRMRYDWLEDEECILVLFRDVTLEEQKRKDLVEEIRVREVIIEILKDRESFEHFYKDYLRFVDIVKDHQKMESFDILQFWAYVTSRISYFTIKLRTFKMENSANALERLMSDLSLLQEKNDIKTLKDYNALIEAYGIDTLLEEVFALIRGYIDSLDLVHDLKINASQLKELELSINAIEDLSLRQTLLSKLWRTQHKRFKQLVGELNPYTMDLASSLGKKVKPIEISGDEIYIDQERVPYFMQASYIIINNAVKHGIEPPRERLRKKKSEYGTIKVLLRGSEEEISIEVLDDGMGIDIDGLRKKLQEKNPERSDEINAKEDGELIECLLNETYPCDFGIDEPGLLTLQKEVRNLNGLLTLETVFGEYTKILIKLPNDKSYVF